MNDNITQSEQSKIEAQQAAGSGELRAQPAAIECEKGVAQGDAASQDVAQGDAASQGVVQGKASGEQASNMQEKAGGEQLVQEKAGGGETSDIHEAAEQVNNNQKAAKQKPSSSQELKELLYPPRTPHCKDYPLPVIVAIFIVYFLSYCFVWTLPNPGFTKMMVDVPLMIVMIIAFRKVLIHDLKALKVRPDAMVNFIGIGFIAYYIFDACGSLVSMAISSQTPPNALAAIDAFVDFGALAYVMGFFCLVFAAPIMEELMFRRALRLAFKNKALFYVLSSILFGIAHIVVGFSFPLALVFIIPYIFSGLGFGFLYERSNNVWASILCHALYNLISYGLIFRNL